MHTRKIWKEYEVVTGKSAVRSGKMGNLVQRKSGNDTALQKSPEHEVKVQFAREFVDVKTTTPSVTESLSSAGSFQSLSSILSSKSSSGICADSAPGSPVKSANASYINSDIPGLDDIIAACADIKLSEQGEQVNLLPETGDLSQDQTFTSAADDLSDVEENSEEESPKEKSKLNETFEIECSASDAPENPLQKSEHHSVQDSSTIVPYVSFEDSVLKTHALHFVNKDSLVFSTAVEFQNLKGFDSRSINEDTSNPDVNAAQNERLVQSNSSNLESHFNASIDGLKNAPLSLIALNDSIQTPLERTQTPTIPLLPSISNVSTILEKDESVENVRVASPNPESAPPEQIPQRYILDSTIPITSETSLAEENLKNSNQEAEIKSEVIPSVSSQIPEEDTKISQEIPIASRESALNSTFPIIPDEYQSQISRETVKATGDEIIFKDSSQCSETEKSQSPLTSPILQSILDKVAEQQKSLDATFGVDEENPAEVEKQGSYNLSYQGVHERHSNLSPVIENSPNSQTSLSSPLSCESPQRQKIKNSTVDLAPEKHPTTPEIVTKSGENLNTPEQLSNIKENEISPSSEILFLQQRTLDSTVIISNENCRKAVPEIKIFPPHKSFDVNNLKINNTQLDSLNSAEKEVEKTSPIRELQIDSQPEIPQTETPKRRTEKDKINETAKKIEESIKSTVNSKVEGKIEDASSPAELDSTVILEGSEIDLEAPDNTPLPGNLTLEEDYETFKPQQRSTDLTLADPFILDKVELEAQAIAKEIYDKSLELVDENEHFKSATSELFQDPTNFDFLLSQESSNNRARDLRFESLYVKFDPLVNRSMLPQGNSQTEDEQQNGKNEIPPVPSVDTPKRNPAIAAIDRLLFYSPICTGNKADATKDMKQEAGETSPQESVPVVDEQMAKELELVRSLVVQHEEKLEKLEKEHEEDGKRYMKEMKKQHDDYRKLEEKNSRLESQLAQEIESKKQVTVVLDEYERSISRLVAERERDRADLEERTRMKEELQAANQHLSNTEAAFNDVHQKYERLKGVVAAYKSNETVLKESVQENVETIKALENRYEQLKSHAMAQLEKANHELETIRKQNEAETVKLQAMLKKAELKSKSLTDLVEQKTKENKELTQILDEVIARVGNQNTE